MDSCRLNTTILPSANKSAGGKIIYDYPLKHSIYQHFQGNKHINLLLIYYQRMSLDTQVFLDMQRYGTAHQY